MPNNYPNVEQTGLNKDQMQKEANFKYRLIEVDDDFSFYVFVKHSAVAPNGKEMWNYDGDHIYFP